MARVDDLRADYEHLGRLLQSEDDGSRAAALVRERRIIGELLEALEASTEVSVADQLAERRARSATLRPAGGRRKSG